MQSLNRLVGCDTQNNDSGLAALMKAVESDGSSEWESCSLSEHGACRGQGLRYYDLEEPGQGNYQRRSRVHAIRSMGPGMALEDQGQGKMGQSPSRQDPPPPRIPEMAHGSRSSSRSLFRSNLISAMVPTLWVWHFRYNITIPILPMLPLATASPETLFATLARN